MYLVWAKKKGKSNPTSKKVAQSGRSGGKPKKGAPPDPSL